MAMSNTAVVTALIGFLGGAISGLLTSYTTLKSNEEKFSIERAELFKELITELTDKDHGSLALLNLWQLYPKEHRIIVLAALETGKDDLVKTMAKMDKELKPHADIIDAHLKETRGEAAVATRKVLAKVDPVLAAKSLIADIEGKPRFSGNLQRTDAANALVDMLRTDEDVRSLAAEKARSGEKGAILFDYLLYSGEQDSDFLERFPDAEESADAASDDPKRRRELSRLASYACCAKFHAEDAQTMASRFRKQLERLANDAGADIFELGDALDAMANPSLSKAIKEQKDDRLIALLKTLSMDGRQKAMISKRSLSLLSTLSPRAALMAVAEILAGEREHDDLKANIDNQFVSGLWHFVNESDQTLSKVPTALRPASLWIDWLKENNLRDEG